MWIYLSTFAVSIGLTACGEISYKKKNKIGYVVCLVLAVLLVTLLAGVRDTTVGTDGESYRWWVADAENYTSVFQAMKMGRGTEPVYMALLYLAVQIFGSIQGLFLLTGLLTYAFAMAALACLREHIALSYGWAAYLFLFYGNSLNQLRQALAMTVVLFALALLMRKKYFASVILLVLSVGIHNTAVLGVGILLVYLVLKHWDTVQVKVVMVCGLIAAAVFYQPLFHLMEKLGFPISRFVWYLNGGEVHFSLNPILVRLPFLLLALWFYREFAAEEQEENRSFVRSDADFLLIMMVAELVTAEMRVISVDIYRISLYFGLIRCFLIGRIARVLERKAEQNSFWRIILAGIMALLVLIWIYQAVLKGNDEIIPYTSNLLHIGVVE